MSIRRILVILLCLGIGTLAGAARCRAAGSRTENLLRYVQQSDRMNAETLRGRSAALAERLLGDRTGAEPAFRLRAGGHGPVTPDAVGYWSAGFGWPDSLAGFDDGVSSAAIYHGEVIVGGWFTGAFGVLFHGPARWDGLTWQPLGGGIEGRVYAMCVWNDKLIVAGDFDYAGGQATHDIAAWDGSHWSPVGGGLRWDGNPGVSSVVLCVTVHNGLLYTGGFFNRAGDAVVENVARWDGSGWSALPGGSVGVEGVVLSLGSYGDSLIAGGIFSTAGGVPCRNIA